MAGGETLWKGGGYYVVDGVHWEPTCVAVQKLFIILTSTYLMHKLVIISLDSQDSA